jgi:hypothetical protein
VCASTLALSAPAMPNLFIYRSGRESPPPTLGLRAPHLFAMCLYCSYCLLLRFSFFPGWRSVCPGGYAALAQGCLWEYRVLLSSPCPHLPSHLGAGDWRPGALLVSPFNVKWRCSVLAGGVEGGLPPFR